MKDFEQRLAASMKQLADNPIDLDVPADHRVAKTGVLAAVLVAASVVSVFFVTGGFHKSADRIPGIAGRSFIDLEGEWRITGLFDARGTRTVPTNDDGEALRVSFDSDRLTAATSCNNIRAAYRQTGPHGTNVVLARNTLVTTPRDRYNPSYFQCSDPLYPRLLLVRHASQSDGVLYLQDANGKNIATLERIATKSAVIDLQGEWKVTGLFDATAGSLSLGPLSDRLGMTFTAGHVSGNSGCNDFGGRYKQSGPGGRNLTFSKIESNVIGCGEPSLVERLRDVRHVSESNGVLYLQDVNGKNIATLERVSMSLHPTGDVLGQVLFGAIAALDPPRAASVQFTNGGTVQTVAANSKGRFSIRLTPGTYTVTATTSQYIVNGKKGLCRAFEPVRVTAESVTPDVRVYCVTK